MVLAFAIVELVTPETGVAVVVDVVDVDAFMLSLSGIIWDFVFGIKFGDFEICVVATA